MLSVKQELLAALADALEQLSPGAGAKAAFESPKVAAHGDFACTAAMQLAKPLRLNPRQLAETLRTALLALPAYQRWVSDIDIAGPGFINIRLQPAAKQQIVSAKCCRRGRASASRRRGNERVLVEFVSANPTGPLHVGHGRQAALGDAICNLYATQGWEVYREFYYNDAGVQIATLANSTQLRAKGFKPGDAEWPEAAYNGEYIQDIANDFLAGKTVTSDDRAFTASGDIDDLDSIRQFAVAYLRHEQDLDLKAFQVHFDHYYLESSLYTSGKRRGHGEPAGRQRQDLRAGRRAVAAVHRLRRRQGPRDAQGRRHYTYFVPDVAYHITKWERGFTKVVNIQGTDHHGTIARVRAGLQAANVGIPARATPTTCCTPWCAWSRAARRSRSASAPAATSRCAT
jgi:arginyl-tRNA synthetase